MQPRTSFSVHEILRLGLMFFKLKRSEFSSKEKTHRISHPRQIIITAIYNNCYKEVSLQHLGSMLGFHHTTIFNSIKKIENCTNKFRTKRYNDFVQFIQSENLKSYQSRSDCIALINAMEAVRKKSGTQAVKSIMEAFL